VWQLRLFRRHGVIVGGAVIFFVDHQLVSSGTKTAAALPWADFTSFAEVFRLFCLLLFHFDSTIPHSIMIHTASSDPESCGCG